MNKNKNKHIKLCMILLFLILIMIPTASAISEFYETGILGRVVGDTPLDLGRQLTDEDLIIRTATYFTDETNQTHTITPLKGGILNTIFDDVTIQTAAWNHALIKTKIKDWYSQPLFILETETKISDEGIITGPWWSDFDMGDVDDWKPYFEEHEPLFFMDSYKAGLYIPKKETIVGKLSPYSVMIAPKSHIGRNRRFTKSFLCNLMPDVPIGLSFLSARNSYYHNVDNELTGLTLQSYGLYGNPLRKINLSTENWVNISDYCENEFLYDLVREIFGVQEYVKQDDNTIPTLVQRSTMVIGDHEELEYENFTLINYPGAEIQANTYELMLPYSIETIEFPLKTIITDVDLVGLLHPIDLTIEDFPSWENEPIEKICYEDQTPAGISYNNVYSVDKEIVSVTINPVEVVNCTLGKFRLYRNISFDIYYVPYSPVVIKKINSPVASQPNSLITIGVELRNILTTPINGLLRITESDKVLAEESATEEYVEIEFLAPNEEGNKEYKIEFIQDNKVKTHSIFQINYKNLKADLIIPEINRDSTTIGMNILNYLDRNIDLTLNHYLVKGNLIDSGNITTVLVPGNNLIEFEYSDLEKEDRFYSVITDLIYDNKVKSITGSIITNHYPEIEQLETIETYEGWPVEIFVNAFDLDGDSMSYSIDSDLFEQDANLFTFKTHEGDAGNYSATVIADDGDLENSQEVFIKVLEQRTGRIININFSENLSQNFPLEVKILFENNDAEALNAFVELKLLDGNETIDSSVSDDVKVNAAIFNGTEWIPSEHEFDINWSPIAEVGNYSLIIIVDYEYGKDQTIKRLNILSGGQLNHPPILERIGNKVLSENELLEFWVSASDPDKDDKLTLTNNFSKLQVMETSETGSGIKTKYKWKPDATEAGNYNVLFKVRDLKGLQDLEEITITVKNEYCREIWSYGKWSTCINGQKTRTSKDNNNCGTTVYRLPIKKPCGSSNNAPVIESILLEKQTFKEGETIRVKINATDKENSELTYSVENKDFIQLSYLKNRFNWKTKIGDADNYNISVSVSDGEKTTKQQFSITIIPKTPNSPPQILPTVPNQVKDENSEPWTIDLTNYENDAEDSGTKLRWEILNNNGKLVQTSLNPNTDVLKFYPIEDTHGLTTIKLTLKDSEGSTDTQSITITLNEVQLVHDYRLKINAKDSQTDELINSQIKIDKKSKYANPNTIFKMIFSRLLSTEIKSKDYITKTTMYYFDDQVPECTQSQCSISTDSYLTECNENNGVYECQSTINQEQFTYDYNPQTEEFSITEYLDKCLIACTSNSQCNDQDSTTTDKCINPNTCSSRCQNQKCNIECEQNSNCNDNNQLTTDICLFPKSCNSKCIYETCEIKCKQHSDCDDNDDQTNDICRNARTCDAKCENIEKENIKPDLIITNLKIEKQFGDFIIVKFDIKNTGDSTAKNVHWKLDSDGGKTDPQSNSPLTIRINQVSTVLAVTSYDTFGSYTLAVVVDPDNLIDEIDESNNIATLDIEI